LLALIFFNLITFFSLFSVKNDLQEVEEESGEEKENENGVEVKTEQVSVKVEKGRDKTDEDIMEEYGLDDYDDEQVS
jgi:hypothetical protein